MDNMGSISNKTTTKGMNLNLRRYAGVKDKLRMHTSGVMYIKKYENESDELEGNQK